MTKHQQINAQFARDQGMVMLAFPGNKRIAAFCSGQLQKTCAAAAHDRDFFNMLMAQYADAGLRGKGFLELPDQRAYWLGRARSVRPNGTKPAGRADGT